MHLQITCNPPFLQCQDLKMLYVVSTELRRCDSHRAVLPASLHQRDQAQSEEGVQRGDSDDDDSDDDDDSEDSDDSDSDNNDDRDSDKH